MGQVVSFYSCTGGIGQTTVVANVAALLSQWKYKVLILDCDLSGAGVERLFRQFVDLRTVRSRRGIVDLIADFSTTTHLSNRTWGDLLISIHISPDHEDLHIVSAGKRDANYARKVQQLNFKEFYESWGGLFVERLRDQWRNTYDFILIDSQLEGTPISSVSAIQLPDILVTLVRCSSNGVKETIRCVSQTTDRRKSLPFDRFSLRVLPVFARFSTDKASVSLPTNAGTQIDLLFANWLPPAVDRNRIAELTAIPAYPAIDKTNQLIVLSDNEHHETSARHTLETITAIIANSMEGCGEILDHRTLYVDLARRSRVDGTQRIGKSTTAAVRQTRKSPTDTYDVFICYSRKDRRAVNSTVEDLKERGIRPWFDEWEIRPGEIWQDVLEKQISRIKCAAVFLGPRGKGPWQEQEIRLILNEFSIRKSTIIPVVLPGRKGQPKLPLFLKQFHMVDFRNTDSDVVGELAEGIASN